MDAGGVVLVCTCSPGVRRGELLAAASPRRWTDDVRRPSAVSTPCRAALRSRRWASWDGAEPARGALPWTRPWTRSSVVSPWKRSTSRDETSRSWEDVDEIEPPQSWIGRSSCCLRCPQMNSSRQMLSQKQSAPTITSHFSRWSNLRRQKRNRTSGIGRIPWTHFPSRTYGTFSPLGHGSRFTIRGDEYDPFHASTLRPSSRAGPAQYMSPQGWGKLVYAVNAQHTHTRLINEACMSVLRYPPFEWTRRPRLCAGMIE